MQFHCCCCVDYNQFLYISDNSIHNTFKTLFNLSVTKYSNTFSSKLYEAAITININWAYFDLILWYS